MKGFPIWIGDFKVIDERVKEAQEAGFDYLEVSLDYPWPFEKRFKFSEIIQLVKDYGLEVAFHAPWRDVKLASPIEEIRAASIEICRKAIKYVLVFEPKYVVVHLSTEQALNMISNCVEDMLIKSSIKSVSELVGFREIVFENVPNGCSEPIHFKKLIDSCEELKLCFDFGHAVISRVKRGMKVEVKRLLNEWLTILRNHVKVCHLHGFREINNYVKDHLLIRVGDPIFHELIKAVESLNPRYVLFEVFEDEKSNPAKPYMLREMITRFFT